jgi:hypothetical protein
MIVPVSLVCDKSKLPELIAIVQNKKAGEHYQISKSKK